MRAASCAAVRSSTTVASASSMSTVPPSVLIMLATVLGFMPVVSSIGDMLPRDGRGRRFMAVCTSGNTFGHLLTGMSSSVHSGVRMSSTILLFLSATPDAHFAYGVQIVCAQPLASVSPFMTALSKCEPPSECRRSGSGNTDNQCSSSAVTTASASFFSVLHTTVVREKSHVISSKYFFPLTGVGSSIKSMWMYSYGRVAKTMYHIGLGIVLPVLVFMHARHLRHRARRKCSSFFLPIMCKQ